MEELNMEELITLAQAAQEYPIAQSTMSQAAREGRLKAQKLGGTWVTTRAAVEEAINKSGLQPRANAKDFVYCPKCGAEYNRLGPDHECDPGVLKALEADKKADKEVREKESK